MEKDFWHKRWENNEIGFHQADINPYLKQCWLQLVPSKGRVLVPCCGKSQDMMWLAEQDFQVLGVEISATAVEDFFNENALKALVQERGHFSSWENNNIQLMCGDFFALTKADVSDVVAVYDRASMIAMPAEMRQKYCQHLKRILPAAASIFLVTMEYPQEDMDGPPFSVSEEEVRQQYESQFSVRLVESQDIIDREAYFKERGLDRLVENVYLITPTSNG